MDPKMSDAELKSLHTRIATRLLDIESIFNRPMQVLLVVHDPHNDDCSAVLCNRPGDELKSCAIVAKRLEFSAATVDDAGVSRPPPSVDELLARGVWIQYQDVRGQRGFVARLLNPNRDTVRKFTHSLRNDGRGWESEDSLLSDRAIPNHAEHAFPTWADAALAIVHAEERERAEPAAIPMPTPAERFDSGGGAA